MKKSSLKKYIFTTIVASAMWLAGSWWHYACNIKNTCDNAEAVASIPKTTVPKTTISPTLPNDAPIIDTDDDGLSDAEEAMLGTDPLLKDSDQDSVPDSQEIGVDLDSPLDSDQDNLIDALDLDDDNDGLPTRDEELVGTSALRADTDDDGILDSVEVGDDITAPLDTDGDGIINALDTDDDDDNIETIQEALLGTNPLLYDSDGDGLSDGEEIGDLLDEPIDKNKNGLLDAIETDEKLDQDNDGIPDVIEARLNTNPKNSDSDNDGISDKIEIGSNLDQPLDSDLDGIIDALDTVDNSDRDNDGLSDTQELNLRSNPERADSDDDGINDLEELGQNIDQPLDSDKDGILNLNDTDDDNDNLSTRYETTIGTNPLSNDSDKDSLTDDIEVKAPNSDELQDTDNDKLINPIDSDDDNDKVPTIDEIALGTNPLKADSDNDGVDDATEIGPNLQVAIDSDKDGIIDALDTVDNGMKVNESETLYNSNVDKKSETSEITNNNDDSIESAVLFFPYLSADPEMQGNTSEYLDKVVSWLKKNPENRINLTGHTDNVGSRRSNLALGIRRVMIIRELLINRGAPIKQIEIMSRGESQPLASNQTKAGRLKNRRVEIESYK